MAETMVQQAPDDDGRAAKGESGGVRPPREETVNELIFGQLGRLLAPLGRLPWWGQVALIYALARFVSFCIFAGVAFHQGVSPWGGAQPDYLNFINIWDSQWYQRIFDNGYPQHLPLNPDGTVQENAWAFYPLFPFLVKAVNYVAPLGWLVLAPAVALLAGLAATLVIYKLFRHFAGARAAMWGVVFFVTFPISPILQVPYAESLSTFLLAASLYLLVRRRYWAAMPVVVLMCLARPAGVPFAAVVLGHLVIRAVQRRKGIFPRREAVAGAALLLVSGVAAVAWPVIAWAGTGQLKAYTDTETAWRGQDLALFKPWLDESVSLVGPVWGAFLPVLLVFMVFLYLNSSAVRRIGTDMRLWCAAYFLYLFAVLDPQTSTFRMLLPFFPLALGAACVSKSRAYRISVVVMFVLLQLVWVAWLWRWTELPTGGDYPP